jgi:hypothetical protein
MVIGYQFRGHDNDSYMLGEETRRAASEAEREFFDWRFTQNGEQHPATCPTCGRKVDRDYVSPSFKLRRKRMDVSGTYDGYVIVSERFRQFCRTKSIPNVEFLRLPSQPLHYWFRVLRLVEVDTKISLGLRFLYFCPMCHAHAGVFGTSRLRFKGWETTVPKGFSRTDLEFAQAHQQHPVIVVDPELAEELKAEKFRGMCLTEMEI